MRTLLVAFICLLLVSLGGSLSAQSEELRIEPSDTVKIGVAVDLSNILPSSGLGIAQSAELAISNFNAEGGLKGFVSVEL